MAGVEGRPLTSPAASEPLEQKQVVAGVGRLPFPRRSRARKSRRVNAGSAPQGGHHKAAVFGQDPAAQGPGLRRCLEGCVVGEGVAGLLYFHGSRETGERLAGNAVWLQQWHEFAEFARACGTENERHWHGTHRLSPAGGTAGHVDRLRLHIEHDTVERAGHDLAAG